MEKEKAKLIEAINERVIAPEQIEDIHEFAAKVREGLANADGDFKAKRAIVDALDLRVILTVENGEKIIYAECALGEEEFNVEPKNSATGGKGPGGKLSGKPNLIYDSCQKRYLHPIVANQEISVPANEQHR